MRNLFSTILLCAILCQTAFLNLFGNINELNKKALDAYSNGNFIEAEKFYELALDQVTNDSIQSLIFLLFNLGTVKIELKKQKEGIQLLEYAKDMISQHHVSNNLLMSVLNNIGNAHDLIGEYELANKYYKSALFELGSNNMSLTFKRFYQEIMYYNLGFTYFNMGDFELAMDYFEKSIKSIDKKNEIERIYPLLLLAEISLKKGERVKSNEYYNEIFRIARQHDNNHIYLSTVYYDYAEILLERNELEKARECLEMSLEIASRFYGLKNSETAKAISGIGKYYYHKQDYQKSLACYQKALHYLIPGFSDTLGISNPEQIDINHKLLYIDILKNKAQTLHALGKLENDLPGIELALDTYDHCIKILDFLKISYLTNESKIYLAEKEKNTYILAMNEAFYLYEMTHETRFNEKVYNYSEKIKSSVLISSIRENEALQISGIPKELLMVEEDLKREISVYENLVYEEQSGMGDSAKIASLESRVFDKKYEYDKLKQKFEEEYPRYYNLKYNTNEIGVAEIQKKLKKDQALLEYTLYDTLLYIDLITNVSFDVKMFIVDSSFYHSLQCIHEALLSTNGWDIWDKIEVNEFYKCSRLLYNAMIEPFRGGLDGKSLIIVPDEQLAGLPFEILIGDSEVKEFVTYKSMPFLIKEHPVCYAYSATMLFKDDKKRVSNNRVLSMVPEYNSEIRIYDPDITLRREYNTRLAPLPGAHKEIKGISEILKSKIYEGSLATEEQFKKEAGKYKILHLATHTLIDDERPLYSKIVFSADSSSEDGLLNTFELYNLELNASLTFLSSCQSGSGKVLEGEGMMSLARGFTYAGCKSMAFTLWDMNDVSASKVVVKFYKYLARGLSKDKALQIAKLEYLYSEDKIHEHPWFWAGIVITGEPGGLFMPVYQEILLGSGVLFLLVLIYLYRIRNRNISGIRDQR